MSSACTCACSTAQGREIDPKSIDWNSDRAPNFTIRQDSGNWNALGAVRIDMPNPYSVYMHDTNHKEFFSADYRFQSSGCTRVEDPRALAAWLLADNPGWGRREIDAAIAKGERTDIRLAHKVPVAWVYLTGWATRDNAIHFRDDVYGHDEQADPGRRCAPPSRERGARLRLRAAISGRAADPTSGRCPTSTASRERASSTCGHPRSFWPPRRSPPFPALANDTSAELSTGGLIFVQQRERRDAVGGARDFGDRRSASATASSTSRTRT